ncbi:Modification methylase HpaII [Carnimonas sp. R-84981]|uniref:DNA cytosine methyltransferase n=1 Tax=Carnimonas bestiolae TaxID=3402172 RepID=UPI003EDC766F
MKQFHLSMDEDLLQRVKMRSNEEGISVTSYVEKCLSDTLNKGINRDSSFKFIDLFAGIGGIRLPFQELGGECVFSSEIDKFAKQTYQSFYGDIPHGDITKINPHEIPDFDVLLAGFPCQPFSQAGLKKGFLDTRGTMFSYIEEIIKIKKPKAFLLENVKGLKGHDKGKTFKVICAALDKAGYSIKSKVLAAKDFNLPQNRERIYIVGFKNDEACNSFEFPEPIEKKLLVGDILENKPDSKYTISDRLWEGHQRRKAGHLEKGNGFGFGLFNKNSSHTNTISARYYKDGSEILIEQRGKNPRKITPIEAARLQGFPDEIVRKARKKGVSDVQLYKQFGNSVAVSVIRAIAQQMVPLFVDTESRVNPKSLLNNQRAPTD